MGISQIQGPSKNSSYRSSLLFMPLQIE